MGTYIYRSENKDVVHYLSFPLKVGFKIYLMLGSRRNSKYNSIGEKNNQTQTFLQYKTVRES